MNWKSKKNKDGNVSHFKSRNTIRDVSHVETETDIDDNSDDFAEEKRNSVVDFEPNKNNIEEIWEFWQVDMKTNKKIPNSNMKIIASTYGNAIDDYISDWNTFHDEYTIGYPNVQGRLFEL
jgi:hypothetical protein